MTPPENQPAGYPKGASRSKYGHFWYQHVGFLGGIPVDMVDKTLNYELEITRSIHGNGLFTDMHHLNSIK